MRGILFVLLLGMLALGCLGGEEPQGNITNATNDTVQPPARNCSGPVCGADGMTYLTDCDAMDMNVTILRSGTCPKVEKCEETDSGLDAASAGNLTKGNQSRQDYCIDADSLMEYWCDNNSISEATVNCGKEEECKEGRCIVKPKPVPVLNLSKCIGPLKPDVSVNETVYFNGSNYSDVCIDFQTVKDYYCRDNKVESINDQCPPGQGCTDGLCTALVTECGETDMGLDKSTRGRTTVTKGLQTLYDKWDECVDEGMLLEHYCLFNSGLANSTEILCGSGLKCVSGRCVKSRCTETDGGLDIYHAGETTVGEETFEDDCIDDRKIREYFCYGDDYDSVDKSCGEGYICNRDYCIEGSID